MAKQLTDADVHRMLNAHEQKIKAAWGEYEAKVLAAVELIAKNAERAIDAKIIAALKTLLTANGTRKYELTSESLHQTIKAIEEATNGNQG